MTAATLPALQRWMREVITHPDGVDAGASTEPNEASRSAATAETTVPWFSATVA